MEQLQEGGMTLEEAKELVKDRDVIRKLVAGRAWKRIFEKRYFRDEALRMVDARCNFALNLEQRGNIDTMMSGIPALKGFIRKVIGEGDGAEDAINAYEENAREELLGEDNN